MTPPIRDARSGELFIAHTAEGSGRGVHGARGEHGRGRRPRARLEIRSGIHTGECERMGDDVGGIAVHGGARTAATARPGEVLVASTVRDLVTGSGMQFVDRGTHEPRGVPGEWRLFAVA